MNPLNLIEGDVLFKFFHGSAIHWAIRTITSNEGSSSNFCHAAMYIGGGEIAESSGGGYRIAKLMNVGHNFNYFAFRTRESGLGLIAAQVITTWVRMRPKSADNVAGYSGGKKFGNYALGTAIVNAAKNYVDRDVKVKDGAGDKLWGQNGKPGLDSSYCSQFVVQAYTAAGATFSPATVPIKVAANRATPAMMHDSMSRDGRWEFLGSFLSK